MYPWATPRPREYLISLPFVFGSNSCLKQSKVLVLARGITVSKDCAPWDNTRMVGPQTHWKQGLGLSHVLKTWKTHPKGSTMCTSLRCSLVQTHGNAVVPPPTTTARPIKFNRPLPASCCLLQLPGEPTSDSQGISRDSVESLSHRLCNSRGF